jgi:Flp pilus assembly protein TadG
MGRPRAAEGAVALEYALVAPVLFAVMFGILQYGYHYWALETAAAAAREAAREMAVGTDWPCARAEAAGKAAGPAVGGPATVTLAYDDPAGTASVGSHVAVTVSFRSLDLGLVPVPDGGTVSQTASARVENVPATPLVPAGCTP